MNHFAELKRGIGIAGWITNHKRHKLLQSDHYYEMTIGDMEHFENYMTRRDVQYIRECGFDHIRIPFDQPILEIHDQPGVYREEILALLDRMIGWCEEEGLAIVLNLHRALGSLCLPGSSEGLLEDGQLQDRFIALWEMLEHRYAHKPRLIFELFNEIMTTNADTWNALAKRCVDALRKINPTRRIIIGCVGWNLPDHLPKLKVLDDEYIGYTFHFYYPHCFTLQLNALSEPNCRYGRVMEWPSTLEKYMDNEAFLGWDGRRYKGFDYLDDEWLAHSMHNAAVFKQEHPDKLLWLGEFGTMRHAPLESRVNWTRGVVEFCKKHDIPWSVWNYLSRPNDGTRLSLVDDDERKFLSEDLLKACLGELER